MGSKAKAPEPPNLKQETAKLMKLGDFSMNMAQQVLDYADKTDQFMNEQFQSMLGFVMPAITDQFQWAREDRARLTGTYQPLEEQIIGQAQREASPEAEMEARARAKQDAMAGVEARRNELKRGLQQYGIGPDDLRYTSQELEMALSGAKDAVLGAETAGDMQRRYGFDTLTAAQRMGEPYRAGAQTGLATGIDASQIPVAAAGNVAAIGQAGQQLPIPYISGAGAGYTGSANAKNAAYANQMEAAKFNANQTGIGDVLTSAALGGVTSAIGGPVTAAAGNAIGGALGLPDYWKTMQGAAGGATGGEIIAPGGPTSDSGALRVSDGEYLLPADVVNKLGAAQLDKFVEKQTGQSPSAKKALPV